MKAALLMIAVAGAIAMHILGVFGSVTMMNGKQRQILPHMQGVRPDDSMPLLGDFNCDSIGFFKTHKTGSSTLALILDRLGAALNKRFLLPLSVLQHKKGIRNRVGPHDSPGPADFSTLHVHGSYRAISMHWNRVLREPGRLTILREPLSRQISHFFYYDAGLLRPEQLLDGREINRLLSEYDPMTPHGTQASEFFPETRLHDTQRRLGRVNRFIRSGLFNRTVFLTLEGFSEGVAALHLHCGWPLKHLAYGRIHCADCWDTKLAVKSPKARLVAAAAKHEVSNATKRHLLEKLAPDALLYAAAVRSWEAIRQRGGEKLRAAARELERRNAVLDSYCRQRVATPQHFLSFPGCLWLLLHPLEFISLAGRDGRLSGSNPFIPSNEHLGFPAGEIPARKIMEDYGAMYDRLFPDGSGSSTSGL